MRTNSILLLGLMLIPTVTLAQTGHNPPVDPQANVQPAPAPAAQPAVPMVLMPAAGPLQVEIVEKEPTYKNRITFNLLSLFLGFGPLTYERGLGDHVSIQVSPTFVYWGFDEDRIVGGGLGIGAGFFPMGKAPRGFRIGLDALGGGLSSDGDGDTGMFVFSTRATAGYTWMWNNGFTMGLHGGIQYWYFDLEGDNWLDKFHGVVPCIDFNLGFAF